MNDRLVTAFGTLLALGIMLALVYAPSQDIPVTRPQSEEAGVNGYLGLKRWLDLGGVPTLSLRNRVTELDEMPVVPGTGNILLVTLPTANPIGEQELAWLEQWVRRGNLLLVMAALNDSPAWILGDRSSDFLDDTELLTGLYFSAIEDEAGETVSFGEFMEETPLYIEPFPDHPLAQGIDTLQGVSDSPTSIWEPYLATDSAFVARVGNERETGATAIWQIPKDAGHLILVGSGSMLSNRMLDQGGNADFLARIISLHLAPGGVFIFDDYHQGLSVIYDADAFYDDSRMHTTLGFILLFWLVYMLGTSGRLVKGEDHPAPPRQADLVRAYGGFMSRKLSHGDTGRLMVDGWLRELERSGRLQSGDPWEQLARMPLIPPAKLEQLKQDYARLGQGRKVSPKALHNQLLDIKRTLE